MTIAEEMALLLEDAADYREARNNLARICQRAPQDTAARALLDRIERRRAHIERERLRLDALLHPALPPVLAEDKQW